MIPGIDNQNDLPSILDNYNFGTVGSFLEKHIVPGSELSFVSAYFTLNAYEKLKENLKDITSLRFLFGEPSFLKNIDPGKTVGRGATITEASGTIATAKQVRQKYAARSCAEWIRQKVEVRSMVKPNFLHGKLYLINKPNGASPEAVLGSSNFTVNGLALNGVRKGNMELNMVVQHKIEHKGLEAWFKALWDDNTGLVKDVKEEVLDYLGKYFEEAAPEFVYFKTLYHLFDEFVKNGDDKNFLAGHTNLLDTEVWKMLYPFQQDGVKSAINKLRNFGGCIIADSVGLGKTFEALAVIKYYELLNQRVLVICPKKLRENWTIYQASKMSTLNPLERDRFQYNVLYHTDMGRVKRLSEADSLDFATLNWAAYDLIVIDESHNFRGAQIEEERRDGSGETRMNRAMWLMEKIIKQGSKTKVLLLSATPVNNTLADLRNQIHLITHNSDSIESEAIRIDGISDMLTLAQKRFTKWADPKKNADRKVKDLIENLGTDFTRLLDTLTIARSRKHIERYYNAADIGKFPKRIQPIAIYPEIDLKKRFPHYDTISDTINAYQFRLYNPFNFLKEEFKPHYEAIANRSGIKSFTQDKRERLLISMMKVGYLKRLESSIESFEISMDRTLKKIEALEAKIARFKKDHKDDEIETEYDSSISPDLANGEDPEGEIGGRLKYRLSHLKLDEWLTALKADKSALVRLHNDAKAVEPNDDAKMAELKTLISGKLRKPLNKDNKKVIVFTAFADTAEYLYRCLKDWAREELGVHIALVAGSQYSNTLDKRKADFNTILTHFSPRSKGRDKLTILNQEEEIDILIATDCISEGQNLQDCDYLVNYDIHWNPVRIIQRFGRIDRLNSVNNKIQLVNFWPTPDLNKYINLKDRVEARMALVDLTATAEDDLLRNTEGLDDIIGQDLKYRDQQLLRMRKEVLDMDDLNDTVSLTDFTLDDFRAELQHYFTEETKAKLEDAPAGLYAIVPSPSGQYSHLQLANLFNGEAAGIVKPGIIFCLQHNPKRIDADTDDDRKNTKADAQKLNPLHPYYLVYVQDDGAIRYRYGHARIILEIFRVLCQRVKVPFEELCNIFNKETGNGEDMNRESKLLQEAIASIRSTLKKNNFSQLTSGKRNAQLVVGTAGQTEETPEEDTTFTLITWLVIK